MAKKGNRVQVILECTEQRESGVAGMSRYITTKNKRKFSPNLKTKRFWSEQEGRWITLKVSAAGMKTINKKGLAAALREAAAPKSVY